MRLPQADRAISSMMRTRFRAISSFAQPNARRNASELIGVVLSRYMIRHEIGTTRRFGWYFPTMIMPSGWGNAKSRLPISSPYRPRKRPTGSCSSLSPSPRPSTSMPPIWRPSEKNRRSNCGIRSAASMMLCSGIPNDSIGSSGFPILRSDAQRHSVPRQLTARSCRLAAGRSEKDSAVSICAATPISSSRGPSERRGVLGNGHGGGKRQTPTRKSFPAAGSGNWC